MFSSRANSLGLAGRARILAKNRFVADMTVHFTRILLLAVLCLALSSCGQRGPLYLPDEPSTEQQEQSPQTP
jgi:predicted small lipoprotein YifL